MDVNEMLSPDWSVTKTEEFDVDFAKQLLEDKCLPKDERDRLRKYYKNRELGNKHQTTYKLGKNLKHEFLGRLCAVRGEGLQAMGRDIRNALAGSYYWDLDFVNAQPVLLVQFAEQNGLVCNSVKSYTERREELLSELSEAMNCERWFAKEKVITLFFGASADGMTRFFTEELVPEVRMIMRNVWEQNKTRLKWLEKQPNHMGKALADILQTEERKCLLALDRALAKRGRSMDVYIHDGGLVRKKDKETCFPPSLIRELEAEVEKETGYALRLSVKEMKTSFVKKEPEGDDYPEHKLAWEETGWKGATYFKLRNPPSFVCLFKNEVKQFSRSDLLQLEEDHTLNDGSSFIKKWLEDADKREYNELVFAPKREVSEGAFNLFRGFRLEGVPHGEKYRPYQELLDILVNHEKASFDYMEKWLAHVVQKPYIKTKVVPIFKGLKGVGKDTFWDEFGYKILGRYYVATGKPEHDVFARFGGASAQKILVKFEEANFVVNKEHEERFKNLITCQFDTLEQKGKETIQLESFINFVLTTNQPVPVALSSDERRFVMFEASAEKKGDEAFWKRILTEFKDDEVHEAYLDYLLKLDISDFNPEFNRVVTETYKDTLQSFIPYHARWFQSQLELNEDAEELTWKARDLYNHMRQSQYVKFDLTETRFGRDMKAYVGANALTKTQSNGMYYTAKSVDLRAYLERSGWLVEL